MANFVLKKGYNIKIAGRAERILEELPEPDFVALQPIEFRGIKPKMIVKEGDSVKIGTPLFIDKANPDVKFVSPVSGTLDQINRGDRRALMEVVIKNDKKGDAEKIEAFAKEDIVKLTREQIIAQLLNGGMWPYLRQRPFNKIALSADIPRDIFISAMDTAPLAADLEFMLQGEDEYLQTGIDILAKLTEGKIHLSASANQTNEAQQFKSLKNVELHFFKGPHPAGNVGVQIHHVAPLKRGDLVWCVQATMVAAIGKFFLKGFFPSERIIAIAGSSLSERKYFKTLLGAPVSTLVKENNLQDSNSRFITGNVLTGRKISYKGFVGFYDHLLSVIPEGKKEKTLVEYALPGLDKESYSKTFASSLLPKKEYVIDTRIKGGERAFVQSGSYEKVLPMDIFPVYLMKSILSEDIEEMEGLGILECDEEDLALCSYICPSKIDFGGILRQGLDLIERES
jgi:Na+-transporting NADH:ubiquinone oxidoreductase subunit A